MSEQSNPEVNETQNKIAAIVANQFNLNTNAYDAAWLVKGKSKDFDYPLAGVQELCEFNNSHWLPWWSKENTKDLVNCRIELVDALHFMLSQAIIEVGKEEAALLIYEGYRYSEKIGQEYTEKEINELSRKLMHQLTADTFDTTKAFTALFNLSQSIGFGFDSLVALYMGKSTLNQFRQDHGYKQKLYKKMWPSLNDGGTSKEDNYYLTQFVAKAGAPSTEEVRAFLDREYAMRFPTVVAQAEQTA